MAHPASQFRDNHVEGFLRSHGCGEGLDRDIAEQARREAETHAEAEANKRGPGRRHRVLRPGAASAADH